PPTTENAVPEPPLPSLPLPAPAAASPARQEDVASSCSSPTAVSSFPLVLAHPIPGISVAAADPPPPDSQPPSNSSNPLASNEPRNFPPFSRTRRWRNAFLAWRPPGPSARRGKGPG